MLRSELRDLVLLFLSINGRSYSREIQNFVTLLSGEYYSKKKFLEVSLYRTLRQLIKAGLVYKTGRHRSHQYALTNFGLQVASHVLARSLIRSMIIQRMIFRGGLTDDRSRNSRS